MQTIGPAPALNPGCPPFRTRDWYPFRRLISHRFSLKTIDEAFTACKWAGQQGDRGVVRGVIVP